MQGKRLHIVCLDAPAPPNYGGVYDLFYKIPELAAIGYRIHLHYFSYTKKRSAAGLEAYCESIIAYPRKNFLLSLGTKLPYIVSSRKDNALLQNLLSDDAPILLEGLHCTGWMRHLQPDRCVMLRMHNNEAAYYGHLAQYERSFWKRLYLKRESKLLAAYQQNLSKEALYLFVAPSDEVLFRKRYRLNNCFTLPVFLPWQSVKGKPGSGTYCLYHGNLSVPENEAAVLWLVNEAKVQQAAPLIIAGKNPSSFLQTTLAAKTGVQLIANPDAAEMHILVQEAHVHLVPSFNETGVKIKLLHALFEGRHCMSNTSGAEAVDTAGLHICDSVDEWQHCIINLMKRPFGAEDLQMRKALEAQYNNRKNGERFSQILLAHCLQ